MKTAQSDACFEQGVLNGYAVCIRLHLNTPYCEGIFAFVEGGGDALHKPGQGNQLPGGSRPPPPTSVTARP
jgi:hypothetical protein